MSSVTVLGTGAMGAGVVANLVAAGHAVTAWNRTPGAAQVVAEQAGAAAEQDLSDAVRDAEFVIACVRDDTASRGVWLDGGALAGMRPDGVIIESSTITATWARELAGRAGVAGRQFLEAPMVGSRPQLAAQQLRYLTAGEPAVLDRSRPILDASAAAVHHVGVPGDAATLKLAVNTLLAVQVAAFGEVIGLLDRAPIDTRTATAVLSQLPITSPAMSRSIPLIVDRVTSPNFPIDLLDKDLGYFELLAADVDAQVPVARTTAEVVRHAVATGLAEADITGLAVSYLEAPAPS